MARDPVAVTGIGVRLPAGVETLEALWQHLAAGDVLLTPHARDPEPAGHLEDPDGFDRAPFGLGSRECEQMDPQQRVLLEVTWDALCDAGIGWDSVAGTDVGVFVGAYGNDWLVHQTRRAGPFDGFAGAGASHAMLANRVSYLLDVHGPSVAVDTACSSSLVALHLACQALRLGECSTAVVAGVALGFDPAYRAMTRASLPFSSTGRCRPFDAEADGILRGEGAVALVLHAHGAVPDGGPRPRAWVRGSAVNHDGRTNGLTAPSPRAQEAVLRKALDDAGLDPGAVGVIEAHGTGTLLGDPIEAKAIAAVHGGTGDVTYVSSVKATTGHLEAAAGLAGVVKAVLALEHGQVPPQVGLEHLNPAITFDDRELVVPRAVMPLRPGACAAVSSFGFGGSNAHVVLAPADAAQPAPEPAPAADAEVLTLAAATPGALRQMCRTYVHAASTCSDTELTDLVRGVTRATPSFRFRAAWSGQGIGALRAAVLEEPGRTGDGEVPAAGRRGCVLVLSGQGSSWPGMGAALAADPEVAQDLDQWDGTLRSLTGRSLRSLVEGFENEDRTEDAQLAIGVAQLATVGALVRRGVKVAAVVGHSMGEAAAAVAAGCIDTDTALQVLVARARAIESGGRGAMVSVALDEATADQVAGRHGLTVAAVNSPGSVVLSGDVLAVQAVLVELAEAGTWHRRLPVGYAFHGPALRDVDLRDGLAGIVANGPRLPLYSTVTGGRVRTGPHAGYWSANVAGTVRFADALTAALRDTGSTVVLEVAPRPVLATDVERCAATLGREVHVLATGGRDLPFGAGLARASAHLHRAGVPLSYRDVAPAPRRGVRLPRYPWDRLPVAPVAPVAHDGSANTPEQDLDPARGVTVEAVTDLICRTVVELVDDATPGDVAPDRPLRDWEVESLTVVTLRNRLEATFGLTVPLRVLLRGDSPQDTARHLVGPEDPLVDLLGRIDSLGEDEVARLLADLEAEGARP